MNCEVLLWDLPDIQSTGWMDTLLFVGKSQLSNSCKFEMLACTLSQLSAQSFLTEDKISQNCVNHLLWTVMLLEVAGTDIRV